MASTYIKLPLSGSGGGGGAVSSFNGRTGAVLPLAGDYNASQVTNVPAGNIAATNVQTAINELDSEKQVTITGAATTITTANLTASRAAISNASGKVAVSVTTDAELAFSSGVTSNIQTQLNAKEPTITVLPIAKGGTNAITAPAARVSLNIDQRSTISNANYTILSTDRYVAQTGTMTAPRTFTLPAASSVNAGQLLIIIDESGTVSTTNTITVTRAGADLINGSTTAIIRTAYGQSRLYSNGTNAWTDAILGVSRGGTGLTALPIDGELLIGNSTTSAYTKSTLAAGSGISITNGPGTITIAGGSTNIDGGAANSVYTSLQSINGGTA